MTRHLLDSDAVIDFLNGFADTVALLQSLSAQGDTFCTDDVVLAEVASGFSPLEQARAEPFLATLEFLPTSPAAARHAGAWRHAYARQGQPLAVTDCLNAAVAHEFQARIVTGNVNHYPMPEVTTVPLPRPRGRRRT
jgi:predicted nucleic acid-binding protein